MAKQEVEMKYKVIAFFIVVALVAGAIMLFNSCTARTPEEIAEDEKQDQEITAMVCAQNIVEDYLVSPSSAEYPSYSEHKIVSTGLRYKVEGYVDSDNALGASLRNDYVVILEFEDDTMESYSPKYVQIGDDVFLDQED